VVLQVLWRKLGPRLRQLPQRRTFQLVVVNVTQQLESLWWLSSGYARYASSSFPLPCGSDRPTPICYGNDA
jgi:hypothetical protein